MTFEEIISRLQNVKHQGANKILASCPCQQNHKHGDRNRSLSAAFDPATGKTLLYCFTGCRIDEICAALDITQADLAPDARAGDPQRDFLEWYGQQNGLRLEAVYNYAGCNDGMAKVKYRDADGKKTFRWIHADAGKKSGFAMGQGDCKHRLYVRGDLTAADVVFLTEGEKDADTVYNLFGDMPAVCTENGAGRTNQGGKWRDEYTAQLAGKHVYILFDNDAAGRAFADIEAAALQDAAAAVYMLDLLTVWEACPDGGDISDLAAEFGAEEAAAKLSVLAGDARPRSAPQPAADGSEPPQPPKSAVDLFDDFLSEIQSEKYRPIATGMPSLDSLLYGGFEPQSLVMLGAAPGMGKTTLAQQIFETMAAGGHEVIYLNLEMSRQQLLARSISRASWKYGNGINAADVMRGYAWTAAQREAITKAAADYRQRIAPRMNYNPDGTTATLESIKETLDNALAKAGQDAPAPIAILDYLQLVQADGRQDPQETIKETILLLKDYAIKGNTIACAVIAFNRASNNAGRADLGSGRDTSSIEYSADTMLALNYADWEDGSARPLEDLQQENPRQLVLKVLKRRMGEAGRKLYLSFDGSTSRFIPVDTRHTGPQFTELPDNADPLPDGWDTMPERSSRRGRK